MSIISFNLLSKVNLRSVWLIVKEAIIWLLSYLLIIHFFIFTTPIVIYRKTITIFAKLYDRDITKIITGLSALFHRDFDSFHKKPLHTIVTCLRIRGGTLTVSGLQQAFMEKVIRKKDPTNDRLAYPELQQHFTRFMGYSFLKWDRQFDIENHVTVFRDENELVVTRSVLMELWQDLLIKPFHKKRSAWEVILVENYVADESDEGVNAADWIIFMRLHHGIADGFCFEKILCTLFDADYVPDFTSLAASSLNDKRSISAETELQIQKLMMNMRCLATGPYEFVNRTLRYAEDYHGFHLPADKKSFEYFVVESELIPVKEIKQIKQRLGVGFTTVLLQVASGAIGRFFKNNSMPLPQLYTTAIPFPSLGRRRDKLENDFLLAAIDLPIGMESLHQRLLHVQQSLEHLRHSGFMIMLDAFMKRVGNFPSTILRAATAKSMVSTSYSSIPGPDKFISGKLCGGCSLIEANFTHGLSSDSLGLVISSITFAGNLRMTLCVDRNLMERSRAKAEQFVECLMEEYDEIKRFSLR